MINVKELLMRCLERGVQEFIVCAGARNAELVAQILRAERSGEWGITVWSHFEERSAGFFALGRTVATGQGCAVITTSGTAVAELLPAVIEAHYQSRPLVVLSTDRPKRFHGTGSPQTIQQEGIFGSYVEGFREESTGSFVAPFQEWSGRNPWHLNIEIEEGEECSLCPYEEIQREFVPRETLDVSSLATFLQEGNFKGLVILLGGLREEDQEEVWYFLKSLGAPILADATSGLREALNDLVIKDGGACLYQQAPGKILRIGEVPVSRYWRDLENQEDIEVYSLTYAPYPGLARKSQLLQAPQIDQDGKGGMGRVLKGLGEVEEIGDVWDWLKKQSREAALRQELIQSYPDSEPAMLQTLSLYASTGELLYLGNSLPIRLWNDFAQREVPMTRVNANRGANGIDGQISSWLGVSAKEEYAWGIIGDLTALYDLSALSLLPQVENKGRVLVIINNGGGQIFQRLPQLGSLSEEEMKVVSNTHTLDFRTWAEFWGIQYYSVRGEDDFDLLEGIDQSEKMTLVEVIPNENETARFWGDQGARS